MGVDVSGRRVSAWRTASAAVAAFALACSLAIPWLGPGIVRAGERNPILEAAASLLVPGSNPGFGVAVDGQVVTFTAPTGDVVGPDLGGTDVDLLEIARIEKEVIDGLFGGKVQCGMPNVACDPNNQGTDRWANGGLAVYAHRAMPLGTVPAGQRVEGLIRIVLDKYKTAPLEGGSPFAGTSHDIGTRIENGMGTQLYFAYVDGQFQQFQTQSRAVWTDTYMLLFIPIDKELQTDVLQVGWYSFRSDGTQTGRDLLPLQTWTPPGTIVFAQAPAATPTPTPTVVVVPPGATPTPTPAPGSTPTATGGDGGIVPIVIIGAGLALATAGAWLIVDRRKNIGGAPAGPGGPQPIGGGGGPGVGGGGEVPVAFVDPCPPLLEAARRARAACEEALKAASAAADRAREAAAEVTKRVAALEAARKARQAAEKELARRQQEPDRSSWMSSGDQYEDSYDLKLKADARAAANAAHAKAKDAATSDADRSRADREWQEQLDHIDSQEGLDELRTNDREGRATWVKEAEEALKAAQQAEADAEAALKAAQEAERAASKAAIEAKAKADAACDEAKAAEDAAIKAGCMPGAPPPKPEEPKPEQPKPEEPKPEQPKPEEPKPDDPKPIEPTGGGGGKPQQPDKPKQPTPPTPPSGGGDETPPPTSGGCEDGAENVVAESDRSFLVPIKGEKVQMVVSPTFDSVEAWLQKWETLDGTEGIRGNAFLSADLQLWRDLFPSEALRNPRHVVITVTLPLQRIDGRIDRVWQCIGGKWVKTRTCFVVLSDPEPAPLVKTFDEQNASQNHIITFLKQMVEAWQAADKDLNDLTAFKSSCQ